MNNPLKIWGRRRQAKKLIALCNEKDHLNEWERNYVKDISTLKDLTDKQLDKLIEIAHSEKREYSHTHEEISAEERAWMDGGYDYIHDFDK